MTIHFITAEIDRQESLATIPQVVEAELQKQGQPLRWAITWANEKKLHVEAVVTTESEPAIIA